MRLKTFPVNMVPDAELVKSNCDVLYELDNCIIAVFCRPVNMLCLRGLNTAMFGKIDLDLAPENCFPEISAGLWLMGELPITGGFVSMALCSGAARRGAAQGIKRLLEVD